MVGSAAGYCEKHKIEKMFVGLEDATEPTCVKCVAESKPKMGRTQVVEDPGEAYFQGKGGHGKITFLDSVPTISANSTRKTVEAGLTLEEIVERAKFELSNLPMPKDIKEFKRVQKVIKTLGNLLGNQHDQ